MSKPVIGSRVPVLVPPPIQEPMLDSTGRATVPWVQFYHSLQGVRVIRDTHASRVAADSRYRGMRFPVGSLYCETDRNVIYMAVLNTDGQMIWQYLSGTMRGTIYSPDQKPTDLTANDDGFLFYSTDFAHVYRWDGTLLDWRYALELGDPGWGFIAWYVQTPPMGVWQLCDGTTGVRRSGYSGLTTTFTAPNLIGAYPKGAAAYSGSVEPAVAPGLTGETADYDFGPTTSSSVSPTPVTLTAGATPVNIVAAHTHDVDLPAHRHGVGTLAADDAGEPAHVDLLPYIRL